MRCFKIKNDVKKYENDMDICIMSKKYKAYNQVDIKHPSIFIRLIILLFVYHSNNIMSLY